MKLIDDRSLEYKSRRIVRFHIEQNDDFIELACRVAALFRSPCVVVTTPTGEHRLPLGISSDAELLESSLKEINALDIEIGESCGYSPVSYRISTKEADFICNGPLDYDFYKVISDMGYRLTF